MFDLKRLQPEHFNFAGFEHAHDVNVFAIEAKRGAHQRYSGALVISQDMHAFELGWT